MKRCPQCQSVYEDAKNFCLNDGTPLVADAPDPRPAPPPPPAAPQTSPFPPAPPTQAVGGWSQAGSWQSQPPGALSQPPPQRKRRVWPWVVGVLGVVVIGVMTLLGVIAYVGYKAVREAERQATAARNTPPGGATRRTDVLTYVNSPASFDGTLKEHYSDFSFQYPASWALKEQPGRSRSNFVKVERALGGDTTLENFAVGWYTSTGTAKGDAALFPQLARQLSTQFAAGFPAYRKVSEGPTRIGSYDGYEFRFTGELRAEGRKVDVYGRTVMLPSGSTTQRNGVALIMLATSLAPEIKSVDDVGVKGELPVILESFRMGKDDAAASDAAPDAAASEAATGDDPSEEIAEAEKAAAAAMRGVLGGDNADAPTDRAEVLEQLKGIEEEWARANNEGDRDAAARILAEEYVGTDHTGATERKAEYIRDMKPSTQVESQSFEGLKVVVAGGRAILSGVMEVDFKGGRTGRFRFVDTFVWRDGRWQAVTSTSSEIQ